MNQKVAIVLLVLSALPCFAGEGPVPDAWSAKGGLAPSPKSAKGWIMPKPAEELIIPELPEDRWTLGAGLSLRNIGATEFRTGVTSLAIPTIYSPSFTPIPGIGSATGFANRTYNGTNPGFVKPNAATPISLRTSDYSYVNPSQIMGSALLYSAVGGVRADVTRATGAAPTGWTEGRDWEPSPYLKLSNLIELRNGWRAGPSFHFSFTNLEGSRASLNTIFGREQRSTFDLSAIDSYDITGLALFRAPYTGGPAAIGPQILANPSRTPAESLRTTEVALWSDAINESVEVDLWGVSFGGEAVYRTGNQFFTSLGAGVVLNVTSWEATRSDTLFQSLNGGPAVALASTTARKSEEEVLFGLYLQAAVGYQVTPAWSVEANLRYDWSQQIENTIGNSSFEVDLGGFSVGLGANYTFW